MRQLLRLHRFESWVVQSRAGGAPRNALAESFFRLDHANTAAQFPVCMQRHENAAPRFKYSKLGDLLKDAAAEDSFGHGFARQPQDALAIDLREALHPA